MHLKPTPIQIDASEPFECDLLKRKEEIQNLSLLISNIQTPSVIAIDSRWGTGKTTFVKMWEQYLRLQETPSLYFNAWETDFSEDPLVSFLGEMNDGLAKYLDKDPKNKVVWEKTKVVGSHLAKRSVPALIKLLTAGALDLDKAIEDELSKVAGALAGDALDNYLEQKKAIQEFHEQLSEFVDTLSKQQKLVIFVDELDRCRPIYAIELLERIKHLFNTKGIIFVLSMDKQQLSHSIKSVYGDGIDSVGYLRRFIDLEYQLKQPNRVDYIQALVHAYELDKVFDANIDPDYGKVELEQMTSAFDLLADPLDLSLREIEQFLGFINIVLRSHSQERNQFPALLVFLVLAKHFAPEAYWRYISDSGTPSELVEYLHQLVPEEHRFKHDACALVEGLLIAAKAKLRGVDPTINQCLYKEVIQDSDANDNELGYAIQVNNTYNAHAGHPYHVNLKRMIERIEWTSKFSFERTQEAT